MHSFACTGWLAPVGNVHQNDWITHCLPTSNHIYVDEARTLQFLKYRCYWSHYSHFSTSCHYSWPGRHNHSVFLCPGQHPWHHSGHYSPSVNSPLCQVKLSICYLCFLVCLSGYRMCKVAMLLFKSMWFMSIKWYLGPLCAYNWCCLLF